MSVKVITGKVRFSYANVFTPKAIEGSDKAKYSVSILIDKSDTATLAKVNKAVKEAIEEGLAKWGGKKPANLKLPLRDGDVDRPEAPEYAGKMFLAANSEAKPQIVDRGLNPITEPDDFYSGCYGRASISFYPFAQAGNKGIAVGLNNLQKTNDGERLGGGSTAIEDFENEPIDWGDEDETSFEDPLL